MRIIFSENGWEDYISWQYVGKKIVSKINELIKSISRTPFEGIGKPEPLKFELTGTWSRRIDNEHRLIYQIIRRDILILNCRYLYE